MKEFNEINARRRIDAWKFTAVLAAIACIAGAPSSAQAGNFFNGFEVDDACWFTPTRVASGGGTVGAPSASGSWHAETDPAADFNFTRWGGYDDGDTCTGSGGGSFPPAGYNTFVDVYLDVDGGFANDTRFDFSSAISDTVDAHRRDFIISCGFYDDNDGPGAGTDRFICSASNNACGWPKNPGREPTVVATTTGWYTLRHQFRDDGSGVLTVDMSVLDSSGALIKTWTNSTASDVIGTTVGGNRYGWFINSCNEFGELAFDNSQRNSVSSLSCNGFEPPMNLALLPGPFGGGEIGRTVKKNRVLPFKATLVDGDGNPVTDLIAPPVIDVSFDPTIGPTEDVTDDALTPGKRDDGNQFILAGDKWTFNLWTKNYTADGTYTVTMQSGDTDEYVIDPVCKGVFVIEP